MTTDQQITDAVKLAVMTLANDVARGPLGVSRERLAKFDEIARRAWSEELHGEPSPANVRFLRGVMNASPEFSRRVYGAIEDGLYAEPGFSDITAQDVAEQLSATEQEVGGALKYLVDVGLIVIEFSDVNGEPFNFLHSVTWANHGLKLTTDEVSHD